MNFEEIINNPSIIGIAGVILGAVIGGITNYINGKQNFKFQKEQNRIEKVEQTTIDFLVLMQKTATYSLMINSSACNGSTTQKLGQEILDLNEQVKAKMQFYFEKDEYDIAMEICNMVNPKSKEEAAIFNIDRAKKINCLINNINKKLKR